MLVEVKWLTCEFWPFFFYKRYKFLCTVLLPLGSLLLIQHIALLPIPFKKTREIVKNKKMLFSLFSRRQKEAVSIDARSQIFLSPYFFLKTKFVNMLPLVDAWTKTRYGLCKNFKKYIWTSLQEKWPSFLHLSTDYNLVQY